MSSILRTFTVSVTSMSLGIIGGAVLAVAGMNSEPLVLRSANDHIRTSSHGVVRYYDLPSCATDDASSGPLPCGWNIDKSDGNGHGLVFWVGRKGVTHYVWSPSPLHDHPNRRWIDSQMADALAEGDGDAATRQWDKCWVNYGQRPDYRTVVRCADGYREVW